MAILISNNKKELIITCKCGCEEAIHFMIADDDKKYGECALMTYMNGNFYKDQNDGVISCIIRKVKKIWAIIRNKDYYYSDVRMSIEDFAKFKEYINQF